MLLDAEGKTVVLCTVECGHEGNWTQNKDETIKVSYIYVYNLLPNEYVGR